MKLFLITIAVSVAALFAGCSPEHITYTGPSYVMFADTLSIYPVRMPAEPGGYSEPFEVPVVATHAVGYDRNFGVEIVMENDAIYGLQYRLVSNTVTIPAGRNSANVYVAGRYDNIDRDEEPVLKLRLVSMDDIEWSLYGVETKVQLRKSCPFDINEFTGYCLVYSPFLGQSIYNKQYPRLIETELVPDEENTVLLKGMFFDGYDVKIKFDPSDLLNPKVKMTDGFVVGDTREAFNEIYGDGRILADNYLGLTSNFYPCHRYVVMYVYLTIGNMGAGGASGSLGGDGFIMEWITDAEAQDYL